MLELHYHFISQVEQRRHQLEREAVTPWLQVEHHGEKGVGHRDLGKNFFLAVVSEGRGVENLREFIGETFWLGQPFVRWRIHRVGVGGKSQRPSRKLKRRYTGHGICAEAQAGHQLE